MSRQFGDFIEQVEPADKDEQDPKQKRLKMIKRQVLMKKVQAVRQGGGEDITASYEPEGQVVEGVGDAVKKGLKRHKDAVEKKKIKNRKAVPYAALAAGYEPEEEMVEHHKKPGEDHPIEEELSRRSKPSAKAKMAKLDAILKRREERKIAEKEALKTEGWLGKKKKEEKKPQKAMDAGAKARRKLARKEYAAKISGSEDNVPDDIRETDQRLKVLEKIKKDRRERAVEPMTTEKMLNKKKNESDPTGAMKPIVAEFVQNLWEASKKCSKCGKVYTGTHECSKC